MRRNLETLDRRQFLAAAAAATTSGLLAERCQGWQETGTGKRRPRVAAVYTVLSFRSHAFNILENFLRPYHFCGKLVDPGVDVVSLYADQIPDGDMSREVSARLGIPLFKTIDEALCLGGKNLAVDAVLAIGEQGEYPYNDRGQHLYPRKQFFDQALAVMRRANRFLPYFNDKHFSYRWDWAREMYDTARAHRMPLLAGSSVPLAQRRPPLELPEDAVIEEAVAVHGGGLESYDFHGLEVLQSIVEGRRGGETGIERVELLFGEAFEQARRQGRWSEDLVAAAQEAERSMNAKRQPRPTTGIFAPQKQPPATDPPSKAPRSSGSHAISITYRDGLKATVLKIGNDADRWNFACRLTGETKPRATAYFNSPWGNRGLFKALSHAIQHLFVHGQEPYPVERTLLTTGAVEAVMQSYAADGKVIETPHLQIAYQPRDWRAFRESGETWNAITVDTPQPLRIEPFRIEP